MKMKICARLLIFELSDCTLRIFRGHDFSIFLILLFLDRYFGVFDSDLRASAPRMFSYGVPPGFNGSLGIHHCLEILAERSEILQ